MLRIINNTLFIVTLWVIVLLLGLRNSVLVDSWLMDFVSQRQYVNADGVCVGESHVAQRK